VAWVRLDDGMPSCPKIAALSDAAFRAHIIGLCYCGRWLTDGFIPTTEAPPKVLLDELLAKPRIGESPWEETDGGYEIHDYLVYNPSREKVLAEREAKASRQAEWRERNAARNASSSDSQNDRPVPVPVPVPSPIPVQEKESARALTLPSCFGQVKWRETGETETLPADVQIARTLESKFGVLSPIHTAGIADAITCNCLVGCEKRADQATECAFHVSRLIEKAGTAPAAMKNLRSFLPTDRKDVS